MTSRIRIDRVALLALAAGIGFAYALPAHAQTAWTNDTADAPEAEATDASGTNDVDMTGVEIDKLDWSQLNVDASTLINGPSPKGGAAPKTKAGGDVSWSSQDKPNGVAALSVKQPVSSFWDARIGADMNVVHQPQTLTGADLLRQRYSPDATPSQSSGTAWAAVTAPGVGSIWDQTAIEARVDPAQDQSKLGTSLSKSLPLGQQYSLTLQNGYNVIQQGMAPVPGIAGHTARNYEVDRSAKLNIAGTGTSLIAGQSLSSTDDKWLSKIGAEQKLFDGVTISGTIGETAQGMPNRSLTAGFKRSW